MTLYTFDRDKTPGKSNCYGKCAGNWPPFTATADATDMGNWTVIVRNDGSKQWPTKASLSTGGWTTKSRATLMATGALTSGTLRHLERNRSRFFARADAL